MKIMNEKAKAFSIRNKRKFLIAGGFLLAVIFAAAILMGGRSSDPAVTQTAQVERGGITESIEAIGVIAA